MDFDAFSAQLDAEKAFWSAANRPDTYDFEDTVRGYSSFAQMVKQPRSVTYQGDYVKAEDYRRDVERLEKLLKDNGIEF